MAKFNGMAVVTATEFKGSAARPATVTNGKYPFILQPIAGKIPSKSIVSAVIMDSMGILPGKPFLVSFTEGDVDPDYGRQFNWVNSGPIGPLEVLQARALLGDGERIDVLTDAEKENALAVQMEYEEKLKAAQNKAANTANTAKEKEKVG